MLDLLFFGVPALGLVIGITQIVKGFTPERYVPIASLVVGVSLMFLGNPVSPWSYNVVHGLMLGLSACGLWDVAKRSLLDK